MAPPLRVAIPQGIYRQAYRWLLQEDISTPPVLRRGSRHNRARMAAVCLCRSLTRHSVREIGAHFGGVSGQAISNLVSRTADSRQRDPDQRYLGSAGHRD